MGRARAGRRFLLRPGQPEALRRRLHAPTPELDFSSYLWQKNGVAALDVADPRALVLCTGSFNQAASCYRKTLVTVDGLYVGFTATLSSGADGVTLAFGDTGPTQLGNNGGSWGAKGSLGTFFALNVYNTDRLEWGRDTGSYTTVGTLDTTTEGSLTWGFSFTKTATNTFTVAVTKDGSLIQTITGLTIVEQSYLGFTGGTGGSSMNAVISGLTHTAPPPPPRSSPPRRIKRPMNRGAMTRAVR